MNKKDIGPKIRKAILGIAVLSWIYTMNKEDIAEKIVKIILIVAGLSLLYFVTYLVLPFPSGEGSIWETLMLIATIPMIMGFILLAYLRHDYRIPYFLRIIGIIFFIIIILVKLRVWLWFN